MPTDQNHQLFKVYFKLSDNYSTLTEISNAVPITEQSSLKP